MFISKAFLKLKIFLFYDKIHFFKNLAEEKNSFWVRESNPGTEKKKKLNILETGPLCRFTTAGGAFGLMNVLNGS